MEKRERGCLALEDEQKQTEMLLHKCPSGRRWHPPWSLQHSGRHPSRHPLHAPPPPILLEDKECMPANSLVSHSVKTPFAPQGWFFAVALDGFYTTGVSKQYLLKNNKYILCFTE